MNTVLITGATSGIGKATACLLAEHSYRLILTGRRNERLNEIRDELSQQTEVLALCLDVRDREMVFETLANLPAPWKEVDVLINNAGNAHGLSYLQEGSIDDWDAMIDINVKETIQEHSIGISIFTWLACLASSVWLLNVPFMRSGCWTMLAMATPVT